MLDNFAPRRYSDTRNGIYPDEQDPELDLREDTSCPYIKKTNPDQSRYNHEGESDALGALEVVVMFIDAIIFVVNLEK